MTDQDAYTLAGWIERARKAEAALTAGGYERNSEGRWVPKLPQGWLSQQSQRSRLYDYGADELAAHAVFGAVAIGTLGGVGFPPIDYGTKS